MNKKRILAISSMASLALLVSGCGSSSAESDTAESNNEITIMAPYIETEPPAPGNRLEKEIEEATGTDINISWVPNTSYEDKMNVTLASDDLPKIMIIQGKSGGFVKSANAGAFWELSDYLDDYPNLAKYDENILNNSSVNGEVYGIYRRRDVMRTSVMIRKDWLDNLGLEVPETTEDLYDVAKAFTESDPDGNGQNDTTGLVIPKWPGSINSNSPYDVLATWFGAPNAWGEEGGKLIPSFKTEEYLESLIYLRDMVENGYINKDFATLAADKWNDPFVSETGGGIIIDTFSRAGSITSIFKETNPDDYSQFITVIGNLKSSDGELFAHPTDGYSGFLAIPKASVKTEEELKEVLSFIDKTNEKEIQVLLNNGIDGVNFNKLDDEYIEIVQPETEEAAEINMAVKNYAQIGTNVAGNDYYTSKPAEGYELEAWERRLGFMEHDAEYAVFNPAAPYISETYTEKGAQLDNIISDARIQFIAGQIDEQGWKDAIELWVKSGGDDIEAEINELYQGN
ncbi:extracellular solute-binding protein [Jeotgalibaca ciconiae]|uniref:Extracellular solute-binding protein n=1 Tax=Jeotgalibaca ciconiae TaxID=2496265 RepID=A0A3S9H929_9LACT|nr:extracellular solute-binding protein [Jeotgalibaca ciconiae]AZP03859.1 extracellular solute-binding protein [Jeotgalibaca ciconiae]HJB23467.1 extracellular solute-binding protein [Candidatus Jeotgalibaca pullicola]